MTEATELLPCPFCGAKPRYPDYDAGDDDFVVMCACGASSHYSDVQADVISAWNTRATPAQPAGMRETIVPVHSRVRQTKIHELERFGTVISATGKEFTVKWDTATVACTYDKSYLSVSADCPIDVLSRCALPASPAPDGMREKIARIIDPDAKFRDIVGVRWSRVEIQRRQLAYQKADIILALPAERPAVAETLPGRAADVI